MDDISRQILEQVERTEQETTLLVTFVALLKQAQDSPKGSEDRKVAAMGAKAALTLYDALRQAK